MDACLRVAGALIDIQGTLLGPDGIAYPGAQQALEELDRAGVALRYVTNIDSVDVETVVGRLASAGLSVSVDHVFTPVSALRRFLQRQGNPRVHLVVPPQIERQFAGLRANGRADYVVVGDCKADFTYERLALALDYLMNGAELVALQKGRYVIRPEGRFLDTGAFVAALEYASSTQAYVLGKPSSELLRLAIEDMGLPSHQVAMVGDDLEADVNGAFSVGARSIVVRTGKFTLDTYERSERKPDVLLDSIADLPSALGVVHV